jgi:hypothetical protein
MTPEDPSFKLHLVPDHKPGPAVKVLSERERALLDVIEDRIREKEHDLRELHLEWAAAARLIGISAIARELGITRQAVAERVMKYEQAAEDAAEGA